ncbi:MAG: ABC transporter ATP-binding protein [Methanotrichaceae archaeon]|nr:ABC transporter ATP-binding protein [Methanotrichaceae archaeon]
MNEIIIARNLFKTLGNVKAVNSVSLDVRKGDFLAIQGASGSGKTTLLSLLSGLDKADTGEIEFGGEDIVSMSEDELALFRRKNVGIVFQSYNLIPTLNVLENIALPLFPDSGNKKVMFERARATAESVGLSHRLNHYPNELSGGEQQRVGVARALINDPKVVFADEPTGNLDTETGRKIMDLLKSLNKDKGLTIVMVTHDDDLAKKADKLIKIKDGAVTNE